MNFNQWKEAVVQQLNEADYLPNDTALNLLWFQQGYSPEAVVEALRHKDDECPTCKVRI